VKGKTTIENMEARSRAMDAEAAREAELDMQELQDAVAAGEIEGDDFNGVDGDEDEEGGPSGPVTILTSEERETEKKAGGPDVFTVQRRLRYCVRILQNFKKLGKGRYVYPFCTLILVVDYILMTLRPRADYVSQLISDIVSYYGYNEFLAEKLFNMFPVGEVSFIAPTLCDTLTLFCRRLSSSKPMKSLGQ
jgi:ribosomal RNA methyltransferase Nop2